MPGFGSGHVPSSHQVHVLETRIGDWPLGHVARFSTGAPLVRLFVCLD